MRRAVLLALVAAAITASAREWFDGGIDRYWPDLAIGGAWTVGGGGYLSEGTVHVAAEEDAPLLFCVQEPKAIPAPARTVTLETEIVFGYQKTLPDPSEFGKAAVTVLKTGAESYVYCVLERDGATNRWAAVAGEPDVTNRCTLAFEAVETDGRFQVTYRVNGAVLAVKEVAGDASVNEVGYVGGGEVASVSGTFVADKVLFDLLTAPGCLIGSVYAGGVRLEYPYEVTPGTEVRVEYHAYGGSLFPNGETTMATNCTIVSDRQIVALPDSARPVAAFARVKDSLYASLETAFAAARGGDTITILADAECVPTLGLDGKGEVALDLNGHTVEGAGTGPLIRVGAGTALTIRGGDVTADDRLRQIADATLVSVEGGSVVLEGRAGETFAGEAGGTAFAVADGAALTVNGGVVAGALAGENITASVYTNGDRLASAAFSQDETARLSALAKAESRRMKRHVDGFWSVDSLVMKLGALLMLR